MTWGIVLGVLAFVSTIIGTIGFRALALRRGILANPNYRSLHQRPMPQGGGLVFSIVFLVGAAVLWWAGFVDVKSMRALAVGGVIATLFGFADDVIHVKAAVKLLVQAGLAAWALFCFDGAPLVELPWMPATLELAASWFLLVWLMNVYNFMDGVDGMAASGAVFFCSASIVVLLLAHGDRGLLPVLGLLALCCSGFLLFNWPPASIFMGDSGSLFLGYSFGALITATITGGQVSPWTWLVIFGYFAGDTTTTTILRICLTRNWYGAHRSHAYQNLARIWGDHRRVTTGVLWYHLLWLLPLAVLSELTPAARPLAAALALGPVVLWTLRYGPRLSSA